MRILFGAKPGNPGFCHSEGAQRPMNPPILSRQLWCCRKIQLKASTVTENSRTSDDTNPCSHGINKSFLINLLQRSLASLSSSFVLGSNCLVNRQVCGLPVTPPGPGDVRGSPIGASRQSAVYSIMQSLYYSSIPSNQWIEFSNSL